MLGLPDVEYEARECKVLTHQLTHQSIYERKTSLSAKIGEEGDCMFGIFGLGDGKMDLQLTNVNVAPGDTLEGTASLTMKKDIMGKEVVAMLYAEKTVMERHPKGGVAPKEFLVYAKSETLDTEKLYTTTNSPYQYKFSFIIPETGSSGLQGSIVRWYVSAEIEA